MSALSFTDKVVLVTGACSPIGSEVARYFSKLGASLVITDSDKYHLNKVADECSGSCLTVAADLTKDYDVVGVIKQTISEYKKLDVLINYYDALKENCGVESAALERLNVINANVRAAYHLIMLSTPHLIKSKGNIVNISYVPEVDCSFQLLSNNVAKSAFDQLTKCLALQLAPDGVRVNAIDSDVTVPNGSGSPSNVGPNNVAAVVVFLASDLACFIFGANVPVDGGKHLRAPAVVLQRLLDDSARNHVKQDETPNKAAAKHEPENQNKQDVHKAEPKQDHKVEAKRDARKEEPTKHLPKQAENRKPDQLDKSAPRQETDKAHSGKSPANKPTH